MGGADSALISDSVRAGGGRLTADPATAAAVVWLAKEIDGLGDILHDGVRWVQLPDAGVERWLAGGIVDRSRVYTSARGSYAPAVAEHAMALILACARDLGRYARLTAWQRPDRAGGALLAGSEVLVVGAGGIGSLVISMLATFGARCVAVSRSGRAVDGAESNLPAERLPEALSSADFVVVCAPSTPSTRFLFGAPEFAAMKSTAYLINVARGDLVDSAALADAVRNGEIAGAGLDVVDPEPLPDSSPLWRIPRVFITPHVANPAAAKEAALGERVRQNTERFVQGRELLGIVELNRGY